MGKFVAQAVQIYKCMVEYNYVYLILFNVNRKKGNKLL